MLSEAILCIALNVWNEARGESYEGQLAVAEVTHRRIEDDRWPSNACDVVYQPWQFEWTAKYGSLSDTPVPSFSLPSWGRAVKVALQTSNASYEPITSCADHFYNYNVLIPAWDTDAATVDAVIGAHKFLCIDW